MTVDDPSSRRRNRLRRIAQAYRDSQEILSICLSLGVFVGGGYWLDQEYGWRPVFTICGVLAGMIAAGFALRRLLQRMDRRNRSESCEDSGKPDHRDQSE